MPHPSFPMSMGFPMQGGGSPTSKQGESSELHFLWLFSHFDQFMFPKIDRFFPKYMDC